MADRYFDRNGVTAGFGTLTGAWDTTTASWSTSSAGTATPATFTFGSADAAFFGAAGATGTAGTATIASGLNVTLNAIRTANLAANQIIASGGAGGQLTFAGTTPTIDVGNAGGLTISAPIAGTVGLTKTGAQPLTITGSGTLSGTLTISRGNVFNGSSTATNAQLPNVAINIAPTGADSAALYYTGNTVYTENRSLSGVGTAENIGIIQASSSAVTFGATSNITAFPGFLLVSVDGTRTATSFAFGTNVPVSALRLRADNYAASSLTQTSTFTIAPTSPVSLAAEIQPLATQNVSGHVAVIENNGTATTTFASGTAIIKAAVGGTSSSQTVRFSGTNTATTTLQGIISQPANTGTLSLDKTMAGRLVLQGTNTLSGSITVSAGLVEVQNVAGLGAATASGVTTSGTGQIELTAGGTYNKSGTNFTIHATNPIVSVGDNVLQTLGITLSGTPNFNVTSGNKLTLAPQGAGVISGSFGLTKSGDGELELTAKANTFSGAVTVSAGTLTVGSVANSGSPGAWGQGSSAVEVTGTLRYNGSGGSTTRSVRMNGTGTPTIDASGTGALFLNSVTQDTNAKTMVLRGTNTDANTVSSNIADNSGAVSLSKLDGGRWVLAGGTLSYTGTTTVSGGTLRLETANSNTTSGAVTIGASGTVELITDTLASSGATAGEVLGTGNVTVNGGTIKTRGGTTQKGQVRYGGNLTFGSGSTLYIGAAA